MPTTPTPLPMRPTVRTIAIVASLVLTACGPAADSGPAFELVATERMAGDTTIVRTESGSVWGEAARLTPEVSIGEMEGDLEYLLGRVVSIGVGADGTMYLVDSQVPELRAYDANGAYLATYGRPGEGPGELKGPDGGLAVLSDGRILVRDPGNGRIQTFTADGEADAEWGVVRGGFHTSSPLWSDREDNVYVNVLLDPDADVRDWRTGLARIQSNGMAADTLEPPDTGFESPTIEARVESKEGVSVSTNGVPFSASQNWALHPGGYFVHGISTSYALTLNKPNGPLRIERAYEAVPVAAGEREARERSITRNMRSMKPDWRWNGPAIPDEKPPYRDFYVGRDGRIWVQVHQAAHEEENPDFDPREEDSQPTRWREPIVFDVFGEDGTYFGRVNTPDGFSNYPTPVFDRENVWAVTRDALGVQRLVRFRIDVPGGNTTP